MNPLLVKSINEKFSTQFELKTDEFGSYFVFPAKNPDFGDIVIYEERNECPGRYMVEIGNFTHNHYFINDENSELDELVEFLENLFSDNIILHGSHKGSGGWELKEDCDEDYYADWSDLFVWSGLYKKTKPTT